MTAIADALPYMDSDMQALSEQVLEKLRSMSDTAFEDAAFHMTLSDSPNTAAYANESRPPMIQNPTRVFCSQKTHDSLLSKIR